MKLFRVNFVLLRSFHRLALIDLRTATERLPQQWSCQCSKLFAVGACTSIRTTAWVGTLLFAIMGCGEFKAGHMDATTIASFYRAEELREGIGQRPVRRWRGHPQAQQVPPLIKILRKKYAQKQVFLC